jgi:energy-converting hydrogenase A subunit K
MNKEKDFITLISFIVFGVIVASLLPTILQLNVVGPVAIFGIILFLLVLLQNKKKFIHITENLEKVIFFITLFIIAISFVILYKPV